MVLGPVIDRLHIKHDLRIALKKNEALLTELQHRIKNNIGTIAAIIRMRAGKAESPEARRQLADVGARVDALRIAHEQLYTAGQVEEVDLGPYMESLLANLLKIHAAREKDISCSVSLPAQVCVPTDEAIPLGLIANEFATNSLKYAFGDGGGTISLTLERNEDRTVVLVLEDDGRGLPKEEDRQASGSGTGMSLIDALARQIGARAEWKDEERGTRLVVTLPCRYS